MCGMSQQSSTNSEAPLGAGVGKRIHAWVLDRFGDRYERLVSDRKRALLGGLRGEILEIGPGTGPNLGYYADGCRWVGVEPNPFMDRYLYESARKAGLNVEIRRGTAEELPAPDASIDAVVSTLVLCSVRDPERVLREIARVLKPGGEFVFIEHVAAPGGTRLRRIQRMIRPLWKVICDGCCPDRETARAIQAAGFAQVELEEFGLPLGPVSPQIAGRAVR